ncbi:hypothetical protein EI77_04162 [Prosthecobacter fusiformis]|uniref:Uncharacterized protein n=1 Tax=Prosthecobacter fusiformis TaxID=48464 RepID=A0A4R7RKM8_9BACT|nr:hypothetical protein [Prosthecobacter fusiformis]TDU64276.1 hypothetical protein EI77_04162 [Prosthecobacter fusiformis]
MSPERKAKIDTASDGELWRLLSAPRTPPGVMAYVREKLAQKAHAETLRKLEDVTRRLKQVEETGRRSSLNVPTFWLAVMAVAFSSFSVPWETVDERVTLWSEKAKKALQQPPQRRANMNVRAERMIPHEPELPADSSSPLADALLLLPGVNTRPSALP